MDDLIILFLILISFVWNLVKKFREVKDKQPEYTAPEKETTSQSPFPWDELPADLREQLEPVLMPQRETDYGWGEEEHASRDFIPRPDDDEPVFAPVLPSQPMASNSHSEPPFAPISSIRQANRAAISAASLTPSNLSSLGATLPKFMGNLESTLRPLRSLTGKKKHLHQPLKIDYYDPYEWKKSIVMREVLNRPRAFDI